MGKLWFCSQSCFLEYEAKAGRRSGSSGQRRPMRAIRKVVKWTLIVLGLFVALAVVLAIVGVGNKSKSNGAARSHPVPLRHTAAIGGGWRMRVLSVTPNANRLMAKVNSNPYDRVPRGAQDFLARVSLRYVGGGKDDASLLVGLGIHAMGVHNASYDTNSCGELLPGPNFSGLRDNVFSGQSVRGYICFQIAKNDARTLMLYSGNRPNALAELQGLKKVWFALRRGSQPSAH